MHVNSHILALASKNNLSVIIPKSHPRAESLFVREKLVEGFHKGLVATEGLIAQGRGEAFDYLIGEKTTKSAKKAIDAASKLLCSATFPIISVNGNVAALCSREIIKLANIINAGIEINLFYTDEKRKKKIEKFMLKSGAKKILGLDSKVIKKIKGLESARRYVDKNGIYKADVVLVPLEDGDRTIALKKIGKKIITIDLNPLSRTAQTAHITIVDNLTRSLSLLSKECAKVKKEKQRESITSFDNKKNLKTTILEINKNLFRRANGT